MHVFRVAGVTFEGRQDFVRYVGKELPTVHSYRILDFVPRYTKGIELYVR